jgi:hypothetical protein
MTNRRNDTIPPQKSLPALGTADRLVYEKVEKGEIDAAHAALYRREIRNLAAHGLIERRESDGAYVAIRAKGAKTAPAEPERAPMGTLVVRVPTEWLDLLKEKGGGGLGAVTNATRAIVSKALGVPNVGEERAPARVRAAG